MTGGSLVGLILLSMAWLFFLLGAVTNVSVLRAAARAKEGDPVPSGIPFIPGVAGSLAAFFTIPALAVYGVQAPWPWFWILLPLFLDVYCLGWVFVFLIRTFDGKPR
ncbi:MAG TPA: hypothetical protein VF110_12120 [Burkholderiales bacterium]|jgi:hypothetical protein